VEFLTFDLEILPRSSHEILCVGFGTSSQWVSSLSALNVALTCSDQGAEIDVTEKSA